MRRCAEAMIARDSFKARGFEFQRDGAAGDILGFLLKVPRTVVALFLSLDLGFDFELE